MQSKRFWIKWYPVCLGNVSKYFADVNDSIKGIDINNKI